jgi:hypothetical protein
LKGEERESCDVTEADRLGPQGLLLAKRSFACRLSAEQSSACRHSASVAGARGRRKRGLRRTCPKKCLHARPLCVGPRLRGDGVLALCAAVVRHLTAELRLQNCGYVGGCR